MEDYVAQKKGAALGARLRRLSASIDADATRAYLALGIRFEQRWFGVMNHLTLTQFLSVRDLAERLGISHASVSEARRSLEQAGLIDSATDLEDSRRRVLSLSRSGQALVEKLQPLWDAFDAAASEIDQEAGNVTEALGRLEGALERKPLHKRIEEALKRSEALSSDLD